MNITCQHCHTKLTIPDGKIPSNKDATVKCPKCRGAILIHAAKDNNIAKQGPDSKRSLSFQDRQSALICIDSENLKKQVQPFLRQMGFNIDIAKDARAALDKMEYRIFHLVLIEDSYDQQQGLAGVVEKMNAMDMSLRRRICLVLISNTFKTNDNMAALHNSVNNIIRPEDIVHLDAFLLKVLAEHRQFYTVYNESLKQAGKA